MLPLTRESVSGSANRPEQYLRTTGREPVCSTMNLTRLLWLWLELAPIVLLPSDVVAFCAAMSATGASRRQLQNPTGIHGP